jgi:hypothetical protein
LSRYIKVKEIYDVILADITKDKHSWKSFLSFHAKVHKHSFNNAVLIYAQKPEATLVADMSIWNKRIGRWINRGAKSIAVIDPSQGVPKLSYLFDIKDTNGPEHTMPKVWSLTNESTVTLLNKNGMDSINHLITKKTIEGLYQDRQNFHQDIEADIKQSNISKRPIEGVISCFDQMIIDSVEYMTAVRCGIEEPVLSHPNPFSVLEDFNSRELTLRLGNAVSSLSERILRDIEKDLKIIQKEQRSELNESISHRLQGRETLEPSNDTVIRGEGSRQEATGKIRSDVTLLSERRASKPIQPIDNGRHIDATDAPSRPGSMGEDGTTSTGDAASGADSKSEGYISELQTQEMIRTKAEEILLKENIYIQR